MPARYRPWRDWILFTAACGVILAVSLFASPPTREEPRRSAVVGQASAIR